MLRKRTLILDQTVGISGNLLHCNTFLKAGTLRAKGLSLGKIVSARTTGSGPASASLDYALICFSHLRWNEVLERPQHLMSRFAREHRVLFWEEPVFGGDEATLDVRTCPESGVVVITPRLPHDLAEDAQQARLKSLLEIFLAGQQGPLVRWYYTPTMLPFSRHVDAICIVYDGRFAPPRGLELERELLDAADLVFTGGDRLDEAKPDRNDNIPPSPSRNPRPSGMSTQ